MPYTFLNNVSTTLATSVASGSTTTFAVHTGDGAKFALASSGSPIRCVVVDTSTTPETVLEYVDVTARSTDNLTVTRAVEDAATYPAAAIASGVTVAAVATVASLSDNFSLNSLLRPSAALAETFPRTSGNAAGGTTANGTLMLTAIALPANLTIGHIAFSTGTQGIGSPTHWWFGLYDSGGVQLAVTADQTSTAWAANTLKSLAVATVASGAASSFTTMYTGLYYLGLMVACTGTFPTFAGGATTFGAAKLTPAAAGLSDTSQTTPPSFPHTATAIGTNTMSSLYGYVAT